MAKLLMLEPLVEEILLTNPICRKDDYILCIEVLKRFIDLDLPLRYVFKNHKELGIPSLETITRCRRKIQERNQELKDKATANIREREASEFVDYALSDKQTY